MGRRSEVKITTILVLCLLFSGAVKADWESDANYRIEQIRKRDVEITVVDWLGSPVPGINVEIEQTGHHFAFGTCIAYWPLQSNSIYRNFIQDHFEWAVCENETKWRSNEPSRDGETYTQSDYIYNWCNNNGIKMRGHCLFWEQDNYFLPDWVKSLSYATYPTPSELLTEVDERIDSAVNHYKGKFYNWDVDNELITDDFLASRLGGAGIAHMYQRAKSVDPNGGMFMNEYSGNSFGSYSSSNYVTLANALIGLGAPIDGLGIQGHLGAGLTFEPQNYYDNVLEPLATLDLPIWATEFDASHTNETISANNIENYFRICFSHPNVDGIIMWGFMEGQMWRDNAYLITSGGTLTERGERYEALMDEWTTSDSNFTDDFGEVHFRGFHGSYEITLSAPEQGSEVYTIEVEPGETALLFEIETDLEAPEEDTTPPTPDPMTWASEPNATGPMTIAMTATTADDNSPPVQYYFECTTNSNKNSGWQTSTTYEASGLNPNTEYSFRVKARDSSPAHNETGWSSTLSATTFPPSTDVEIVGSWETGLSHTKEFGVNRALIFIAHGEMDGTMNLADVYYGGQEMTKIIDRDYRSTINAYVAAFVLDEAGIADATNGTFSVNWDTDPAEVKYASVFLSNVNQADPNGAEDSNEGTSDTITTSALTTGDGDMVIDAATCGNMGTYILNNNFIQGVHQSSASSTGVTGYKSATGTSETPSASHNSVNRQVIIGFVINAVGEVDYPPAAPTGLTATAGNQMVSLDWNDNNESDLSGYNVYRSTTSGSDYDQLNVSLVSTSDYIDDTVNNGMPYYYVVTAVDANDQESSYSGEDSATPDYQDCNDVQLGGYGLGSDLDGDCYVNYRDLEIIVYYWLYTNCSSFDDCEGADFEPTDGVVDFLDFSDFAVQWLQCNSPEDSNCTQNW